MEELKTISDLAQLGGGVAIGFGAIGAGLGIGFATKGLMDAISRQPEVSGKAFGFFLLGAALSNMEFNATFLVSAISFLVFVFIMNKIFYAPLTDIIEKREKLVDDTLNEAKNSRDKASGILTERENKLTKARDDSKKIISSSVEKANADSKEMILKAKDDSTNEINSKKADLAAQNSDVQSRLSDTVNELANVITTKILG